MKKITLAVIDDNRMHRQGVKDFLLLEAGDRALLEVVLYFNCADWQNSGARRHDFYLVDYRMPGKKGPACVEEIKALYPNAVVIGNSSMGVEREFLGSGADHFLVKGEEKFISRLASLILG